MYKKVDQIIYRLMRTINILCVKRSARYNYARTMGINQSCLMLIGTYGHLMYQI